MRLLTLSHFVDPGPLWADVAGSVTDSTDSGSRRTCLVVQFSCIAGGVLGSGKRVLDPYAGDYARQ